MFDALQFYMHYIFITLYVIQLFAAKYMEIKYAFQFNT